MDYYLFLLLVIVLFNVWSLFCNEVLTVLHNFAIVLLKKIELVALQVPLLLCDLVFCVFSLGVIDLSVVCDPGISWSNALAFSQQQAHQTYLPYETNAYQ